MGARSRLRPRRQHRPSHPCQRHLSVQQQPCSASMCPASRVSGDDHPATQNAADRRAVSDMFGDDWFATLCIANLYLVTALIVLVEIFFLNSIKRPYVSVPWQTEA